MISRVDTRIITKSRWRVVMTCSACSIFKIFIGGDPLEIFLEPKTDPSPLPTRAQDRAHPKVGYPPRGRRGGGSPPMRQYIVAKWDRRLPKPTGSPRCPPSLPSPPSVCHIWPSDLGWAGGGLAKSNGCHGCGKGPAHPPSHDRACFSPSVSIFRLHFPILDLILVLIFLIFPCSFLAQIDSNLA